MGYFLKTSFLTIVDMHPFQKTYYRMAEETFPVNSSINLLMGEKRPPITLQLLTKWPASTSLTSITNNFFSVKDDQVPTNTSLIEDIDIFTLRFIIINIFARFGILHVNLPSDEMLRSLFILTHFQEHGEHYSVCSHEWR